MLHSPKFNPAFQSDSDSVLRFVVRIAEFDRLVERLLASGVPPRALVEGPRGAGKTTLCRRILAESRAGTLSSEWIAVALGEESYGVTTPGEFFLECLFQLDDQHPSAELKEAYRYATHAESDVDLVRRAVAALQRHSRGMGKKLLIIVENFHVLLKDQIGREAEDVLSILRDETLFGILATSVPHSSGGDSLDALLSDFLRLPLRPLTLQECSDLWTSLTSVAHVSAERIRPLQILTGGNPRLLHILAEFMKTPSLRDLMTNLNFLIDENTEYFRNQLDALPTTERKVFVSLLDAWDPVSAKQVAELSRVSTNVASAMLSRLADRGAVTKDGTAKATVYSASERLFNIYYLMRRRSTPSSRVRALVAFMTQYYDHDELVSTTTRLMTEACSVEPVDRAEYYSTFEAIISHASTEDRLTILARTPIEFVRAFREDLKGRRKALGDKGDDDRAQRLIADVESAMDEDELSLAEDRLGELIGIEPDAAEPWVRLAMVRIWRGDEEGAIEAARRAVELEPADAWTHAILGDALATIGETDEAANELEEALRRDPRNSMALTTLAGVRANQGDTQAALRLYRRASTQRPFPDVFRAKYATLLAKDGNGTEGEKLLRRAARRFENSHSRRALVQLLDRRGGSEEAVAILSKTATSTDAWEAWADLGTYLLARTDRYVEAQDALQMSVRRGAESPGVFRALGQAVLRNDGGRDDVASIAKMIVAQAPDDADYWLEAGRLYAAIDDSVASEDCYRKAISIDQDTYANVLLARLLSSDVGRADEAQAILQALIGKRKGARICAPSRELADMLVHLGDDASALAVVDRAIESNKRCYCCLVIKAGVCRRLDDLKSAERYYEEAIGIFDAGVEALVGLAGIVDRERAEQLIERAIAMSPDDPRCLTAKARHYRTDPEAQFSYIHEALSTDPTFVEAHILLAPLEAAKGNKDSAVRHLETALQELPTQREWIPEFVSAAIAVARLGMIEQVLQLLRSSDSARLVEPLEVAVQLLAGSQPLVAREILEVAKDIIDR